MKRSISVVMCVIALFVFAVPGLALDVDKRIEVLRAQQVKVQQAFQKVEAQKVQLSEQFARLQGGIAELEFIKDLAVQDLQAEEAAALEADAEMTPNTETIEEEIQEPEEEIKT